MRATFEAGLDALPNFATVVLVAVGAWRIDEGAINTGELIGLVALFGLLSWPMRFIGWILAELPRAVVGYDRLRPCSPRITVCHRPTPSRCRRPARAVRARRLPDLRRTAGPRRRELRCRAGESVAIVGPTGVDDPMVQLLVRLADPDEGAVSVGGSTSAGQTRWSSVRRPRSCSRASCSRRACARTSRSTNGRRRRGGALGDDRLGRPVHPRAAERVRHGGRRARAHALGRTAPEGRVGEGLGARRASESRRRDVLGRPDGRGDILHALRRELNTTLSSWPIACRRSGWPTA